jgi:hypothetical protein
MDRLRFFGLLHLADDQFTSGNASFYSFNAQLKIYVRNAALLARTLRRHGAGFTLLTNDPSRVERTAAEDDLKIDAVSIPFVTPVPGGIPFYSAHFKFDVFRYLAGLGDVYACLCDLDMVCARPIPDALLRLVRDNVPVRYDISAQVIPAYGADVIARDLEALHGMRRSATWSGGEFIGGPSSFFAELTETIDRLFPRYLSALPTLHHVGDECATSAALEAMTARGVHIEDAGRSHIVGRYWSIPTRHRQAPWASYSTTGLLHLPADKVLLSRLASITDADLENVVAVYRRSLMRSPRHLARCAKVALSNLRHAFGRSREAAT